MVRNKINYVFVSSTYTLLMGIFFLLLNFANNLNFEPTSPYISDAVPSIHNDASSSPMKNIPRVSSDIANTFSSTMTFSATRNIPLSSYISINGRVIATYNAINGTEDDAGGRVAKYNNNFYYGHNTANVFGSLASLPIGSTFSITENGLTKTYRIASSELFEKTGANVLSTKAYPNRNFSNGIYAASYLGKKYDIALMTCAGTMLGGGDATERYVVFAYEV